MCVKSRRDGDLPRFGVNFSLGILWRKISPESVSHLILHCVVFHNYSMAAQGEDTVVVNKNKRFRKDKRVTLLLFFFFFLFGRRLIVCCWQPGTRMTLTSESHCYCVCYCTLHSRAYTSVGDTKRYLARSKIFPLLLNFLS